MGQLITEVYTILIVGSVRYVEETGEKGIFAIRLNGNDLLWDRKEQGGFPSPKGLKQIVRDMVEPNKCLGHSDTEERQQHREEEDAVAEATLTPVS